MTDNEYFTCAINWDILKNMTEREGSTWKLDKVENVYYPPYHKYHAGEKKHYAKVTFFRHNCGRPRKEH
jgi:hypothetical protein